MIPINQNQNQNQRMFLKHPRLSHLKIPIKSSNLNKNRNRLLNRKRRHPSPRSPLRVISTLNNQNRLSHSPLLSQPLRAILIFLLNNKNNKSLNLSHNSPKITSLHSLKTINPKETDKVQAFPSTISKNQQNQNQSPQPLQTQSPCAIQIKNANMTTYTS